MQLAYGDANLPCPLPPELGLRWGPARLSAAVRLEQQQSLKRSLKPRQASLCSLKHASDSCPSTHR